MRYDITEYAIESEKVRNPLCIALLADIHDHICDELLADLRERHPSLICITGDLVNGYVRHRLYRHASYEKTLGFLDECSRVAPTFLSIGNHERVTPSEQLYNIEKTDIMVLDDCFVELPQKVVIGGLSAAAHSYQSPEYLWLSKFQKMDDYKILLSHRPEYFDLQEPRLSARPIDLVLSGHAHGGQIRIGKQGMYAPGQGFFPRYTAGIHKGNFGQMIISRGLSNTTWIPRINNKPEIVYIEVKSVK